MDSSENRGHQHWGTLPTASQPPSRARTGHVKTSDLTAGINAASNYNSLGRATEVDDDSDVLKNMHIEFNLDSQKFE